MAAGPVPLYPHRRRCGVVQTGPPASSCTSPPSSSLLFLCFFLHFLLLPLLLLMLLRCLSWRFCSFFLILAFLHLHLLHHHWLWRLLYQIFSSIPPSSISRWSRDVSIRRWRGALGRDRRAVFTAEMEKMQSEPAAIWPRPPVGAGRALPFSSSLLFSEEEDKERRGHPAIHCRAGLAHIPHKQRDGGKDTQWLVTHTQTTRHGHAALGVLGSRCECVCVWLYVWECDPAASCFHSAWLKRSRWDEECKTLCVLWGDVHDSRRAALLSFCSSLPILVWEHGTLTYIKETVVSLSLTLLSHNLFVSLIFFPLFPFLFLFWNLVSIQFNKTLLALQYC